MSRVFTDGFSRESDIRETLIFMLVASDPGYMRNVDLEKFEQGLIDEVYFLLPGDEDDKCNVERYIRDHKEELYQIAHYGQWETGIPMVARTMSQLRAEFSVDSLGPIAESGTEMFRFENNVTHKRGLVIARDESEAWGKFEKGKYLAE